MFKRILAPVDGSKASQHALDIAVDIAEKYSAELVVLCVYKHHSSLDASLYMIRPYDDDPPDKALLEFATEVVEAAKDQASQSGFENITGYVKQGQPSRTIVSFAKDHAIDLIVIGSRGAGDIEGFLLGSVSHKVTSLAQCPCLTA